MKILNILFGKKEEKNNESIKVQETYGVIDPNIFYENYKDIRKAECPYCFGTLKKIPGSKTKCPHCLKYMYVKTNEDNIKNVVTEEESDRINKAWAEKLGLEYSTEVDEEKVEEEDLDFETKIDNLKKELNLLNQNNNFASYTIKMLYMGDLVKKEGNLLEALKIYLEVCYLDLNGPNNRGEISPELLEEFPVFDATLGLLAPAIIGYIKKISKKLNISIDELKNLFFNNSFDLKPIFNLPISKDRAWIKIKKELLNVKNS